MTTVTESYPLPMRPDERCYPDAFLTPLCPWPQRCCLTSQLGPVKNEDGGSRGSRAEDLSVIVPTGCSYFAVFPPPSFLSPLSSQWKREAGRPGGGVVINPEVVNSALAFHLNVYLHLNRPSEGPSRPSGGHKRCPEGLMEAGRRDECYRV